MLHGHNRKIFLNPSRRCFLRLMLSLMGQCLSRGWLERSKHRDLWNRESRRVYMSLHGEFSRAAIQPLYRDHFI